MQKTKILAVAPYEGMADAISAIAQTRDDIRMTVQTGDLDNGKKSPSNWHIIIMTLLFQEAELPN